MMMKNKWQCRSSNPAGAILNGDGILVTSVLFCIIVVAQTLLEHLLKGIKDHRFWTEKNASFHDNDKLKFWHFSLLNALRACLIFKVALFLGNYSTLNYHSLVAKIMSSFFSFHTLFKESRLLSYWTAHDSFPRNILGRYYIVDICVVVLQLERLMTWIKIRRLSHLRPLLTGPSDIQTMTVPTMSVRVAQQTTAVQPSSI